MIKEALNKGENKETNEPENLERLRNYNNEILNKEGENQLYENKKSDILEKINMRNCV